MSITECIGGKSGDLVW